jgi:hypothetical protein
MEMLVITADLLKDLREGFMNIEHWIVPKKVLNV